MADKTSRVSIGRAFDYMFGRNTMIGFAELMLLLLAGYATWHGMRDFIVGVSQTATQPSDGMSLSNDVLVVGVVVALTFLMWLALRETFGSKRRFGDRIITFLLYAFLALWSIGFGYGFWWSLISGQEATRTGLSGLQEDARDASQVIAARLDAVRGQLDSVVSWSDGQMTREETSGGSCGKPSGAGKGPLYNARRSVRDSITTLRDGMQRSWLEPVQADVEQLRQAAATLQGGTVEERQKAFETAASDIRGRARNIAARSNALGSSTASEMRAIASAVSTQPDKPGFSCYDPTLAQRLNEAANQAEQPAELKLREAVFNEGPAGVANAVKNLWKNIGAYSTGLVSYIFSGGRESFGHTGSGEPITGRDLIALLATIGVDLGILVLSILNPVPAETRQLSAKEERQVEDAVNTAIASTDDAANMDWVRRHFVHHNKSSYLVIPNLYSADAGNPIESKRALAMNQLAGVLSDMELVRWPEKGWPTWSWWPQRLRPFKSELQKLKAEESHASDTDLTDIRKEWIKNRGKAEGMSKEDEAFMAADPLRNHGIFSKAERALTIAGWSPQARRDIEIFPIVEVDGLTPLLMVLNKGHGGDQPPPAATPSGAQPAKV